MPRLFASRITAALLAVTLIVPAVPAGADEGGERDERTISCESYGYRYRYCRVDTDNRVSLERQRSFNRCELGRSWGYDSRGVWVDRGCAAEFRVGRGGGNGKEAAIGAAVAVGAIAAIIAANKHGDKNRDEVPSWAVGSFRGYDAREQADVELRVSGSGTVDGDASGNRLTGSLKGNRLEVGRYRFAVTRANHGFVATDEADKGHQIVFSPTTTGWGQ